jgi:hypothetical protein
MSFPGIPEPGAQQVWAPKSSVEGHPLVLGAWEWDPQPSPPTPESEAFHPTQGTGCLGSAQLPSEGSACPQQVSISGTPGRKPQMRR